MKPIAPDVQRSTWQALYDAAKLFYDVRPWEVLVDTDVFGVRDPETGEVGFCVVLGNAGEFFGFCLYRGPGGFDLFDRMARGEIREDDVLYGQNFLRLEFSSRQELEAEDRAVIKSLSLKFRGEQAWPQFRSCFPAEMPWFVNEAEAIYLTLALNISLLHYRNILTGGVARERPDGACYVYSPTSATSTSVRGGWEPVPVAVPEPVPLVQINRSRIAAILKKGTLPDSPWEAEATFLLAPTMDRARPYFPRMAIACQQSSGFILAFELFPPEEHPHQLLANIICTSIEQNGYLPGVIFVNSDEAVAALYPLAVALDIVIRQQDILESTHEALEALSNHLHGGGDKMN